MYRQIYFYLVKSTDLVDLEGYKAFDVQLQARIYT